MTFTVVPGFRLHFDWSLLLTLTVILLLAIGLPAATTAQPSQGTQATSQKGIGSQEVMTLELGKPVEREIAGGQTQGYWLILPANQYLKIVVDQYGVDVTMALFAPDGQKVYELVSAGGKHTGTIVGMLGPKPISWVTGLAGKWRLTIKLSDEAAIGQYQVKLTESRVATDLDRDVVAAVNLSNESDFLNLNGKREAAISAAQQALELFEKVFGSENLDAARALYKIGGMYLGSDLAKAEQYLARALTIREKFLGTENVDVANTINNLGIVAGLKGDYAKAEDRFLRALVVYEKVFGPTHPEVSKALSNLAEIYTYRGDFDKVVSICHRLIAIWEKTASPEHPQNVGLLMHLASAYYELGDDVKAEPVFQRALALREKMPSFGDVSDAEFARHFARLYSRNGNYQKAAPLYQRALALLDAAPAPERTRLAAVLLDIAQLYRTTGQTFEAQRYYQRAMSVIEEMYGAEHHDLVTPLEGLAWLSLRDNNLKSALWYLSRYSEVRERDFTRNLITGSERQKLIYIKLFARHINEIIALHAQYAPNNATALQLAFTTLLQSKGRALDAMADNVALLRSRATQQNQALFEKLATARSKLATLTLAGLGTTKPEIRQSQLKQLEIEVENLEAELGTHSSIFRAQSQSVTLASVQLVIPSNATLIEFVSYRHVDSKTEKLGVARYLAYVLTANEQPRWTDLGEAAAIDQAVEAWRKALRDPKRTDVRRLARAVDEKVMRPVRALLGETKHLLIAPDGLLNLIPFEALVDERNRYLVESYSLSYLSSGRDLLRMQVARESGSEPMVMANPAFGNLKRAEVSTKKGSAKPGDRNDSEDLRGQFFGPLPGTAQEAAAIKRLFPQSRIFTEAQATEAELKKAVAPKILHVATHGFFLADQEKPPEDARGVLAEDPLRTPDARLAKLAANIENPLLRAGLAFAGANEGKSGPNGEDDGVLTAMEATTLNLWGTKLVVLSACDTGVGEVKNGEGVYGLRRAFVLAGAETLLMSLWPVSDKETKRLMIPYYSALKRGDGRGKALRQVQLQLIRSKNNRHPFYWAGFIQSGEWANLAGQR